MHPFFSLRDQLPALAFDPLVDTPAISYSALRPYLDLYQLTFAPEICRLHVMGTFRSGIYDLVAHYWLPKESEPKGTVFFLHGYYDHVGLFSHLIGFLLQQGLAVVSYDQPGHGLSSGEQASINDFAEYAEVLRDGLQGFKAFPQPWYGLAQSTGCAVYLHALMKERIDNPFKKIVLLAPLIRPAHWRQAVWLYRVISPFSKRFVRYKYASSHNQGFLEFIHHQDPLQSKFLKTAWVKAMKQWAEEFPLLEAIMVDLLVIQGEEDETVDWRYNLPQLQLKLKGAQFCRLPGASHHLANEGEALREKVFGQIKNFLLAS
jgi:alpha-beta hydrolase superfamily lysophospholipase